jgi:hypothetical protein
LGAAGVADGNEKSREAGSAGPRGEGEGMSAPAIDAAGCDFSTVRKSGVSDVCGDAGWFFSDGFGLGVRDADGAIAGGGARVTTWTNPLAFGSAE